MGFTNFLVPLYCALSFNKIKWQIQSTSPQVDGTDFSALRLWMVWFCFDLWKAPLPDALVPLIRDNLLTALDKGWSGLLASRSVNKQMSCPLWCFTSVVP